MSQSTDTTNANNAGPSSTVPATGALETVPIAGVAHEDTFPPNTPLAASTTSFILGSLFSLGSWLVINNSDLIPAILQGRWHAVTFNNPSVQISFFMAAWAFFHWAEFAVTAGWNREKCSSHSFLLDNGVEYHIAHTVAITEFLITAYFFPNAKKWQYITPIGMAIVLVSQVIRSVAMIHAATNFSHMVAFQRRQGHQLVTKGIYGWSRHPSYVGFFYWGIGTQIVLQNPISFIGYFVVLLRFFARRINYEEQALTRFFGADYTAYRFQVPTRLPGIR